MSEKGSTLGRGPSLSFEREQRSEGRLLLRLSGISMRFQPKSWHRFAPGPSDGRAAPVVARSSHCPRLPPPRPITRAAVIGQQRQRDK